MSMRIYRLLRNNKEEGPFTPEELVKKSLRPYDLIWIDGRSASWHYPGELSEFKQYAPLPTDENSQPQPAVSASVQAAVAINNLAAPVLSQKPRYRVSAAWSKIQTAATPNEILSAQQVKKSYTRMVEPQHSTDTHSKSLSWEEAWQDWEQEKKSAPAAADTRKANTGSSKQSKKQPTPVLETKYSASLDDLKDQYIEHIITQKQKNKKRTGAAFILPAVSLIIIFSGGYWLLHNTSTGIVATTAAPVTQPVEKAAETSATPVTGNRDENSNTAETPVVLNHAAERKLPANSIQHKPVALPVQQQKATNDLPENFIEQVAAVNEILQKNTPQTTNTNNAVRNSDAAANSNKTVTVPAESTEAAEPHVKSTADYVWVPQHIDMKNGNASITIKNVGGINLDLVVINVEYFDMAHMYRKGETLYVYHLKAGKNTIVNTPQDTNTVYATAKVSLVNADAENISVIGEN